MRNKLIISCLLVYCLLFLSCVSVAAATADSSAVAACQAYTGSDYNASSGSRTAEFGTLRLNGVCSKTGENSFVAEGAVSISYDYDARMLNGLMEDARTVVDGYDLSASVRKGAIILERRSNGHGYETLFAATNIFKSNPQGISELYTIPFEDLFCGCQYRVRVAYQCGYKRSLQIYEFKLKPMRYVAMVRDSSSGELLTDQGCTDQGFSLVFLSDSETISVSYNDSTPKTYYNSKEEVTFTQPGKYQITSCLYGREADMTVYVLPAAVDELGEMLFGESMLSEDTRIFTTENLPCYNKAAIIHFNNIEHLPPITVTATNLSTGKALSYDAKTGSSIAIAQSGDWQICVNVGSNGSIFQYSVTAKILDQEGPSCSVNEYLLENLDEAATGNFAFIRVPYQNDQAVIVRNADGVYRIATDVPLKEQIPAGVYTIEEYNSNNEMTYCYTLSLREQIVPVSYKDGGIALTLFFVAAAGCAGSGCIVYIFCVKKGKKEIKADETFDSDVD